MTDDTNAPTIQGRYGLHVRVQLADGGRIELNMVNALRDEVQAALDFIAEHFTARSGVAAERSTAGGA